MAIIFQEAAVNLPRLSQSSLYNKFEEQNHITEAWKETISKKEYYVKPEEMKEIMSMIRLNGSPNAKKATEAFEQGRMILIFNKDRSVIPAVLPFIVVQTKSGVIPYVFADRVVTNLTSTAEYTNLMATMEAAYLAAALVQNPTQMVLNRQFILCMAQLYNLMWLMPLEQKLYMKGDNLTKAMMYITAYFYRMIDGDKLSPDSIPFNRILKDKVNMAQVKQIVMDVQMMPSLAIGNLIDLIKKINPVRYKNLDSTFMTYFVSTCGVTLIFALRICSTSSCC
jgi:hypothetical protein